MKIVALELKNDTDLDLLAAFAGRLDGGILKVEQVNDTSGKGPVFWLDELSKRGGVSDIKKSFGVAERAEA